MPLFFIAPREAASGSRGRELVGTVSDEPFWLTLPAALGGLRGGGVPMRRHLPTAVVAAASVAAATLGCSNETPTQTWQESRLSALRSNTAKAPTLTPQPSGTTNGLIAISPVSSRVVWVSGRSGTYAVTTNGGTTWRDRKSTRLNSSHGYISYAVFCLK